MSPLRLARARAALAALPALLLTLAGCATNPVTGEQDFVLMSEEQELALGRQYHQQILREMGPYEDPALADYVQDVGTRLAAESHRPDLIYRFTVLDSDQVNAFALPGGYIYITRGLLAYLNTEAELAAVLGHEIGHVTARHSVRQHSAATATGILGAVVASASGVRGAGDLANVLGTALVRGYGREHELEADRLGARYLARTGYDPNAMLAVIGVLKDQETFEKQLAEEENREPNVYHGVFATHPRNDQRLQTVVAEAGEVRTAETRRLNRDVFLGHLEGLVFGDSEDQGVRRGNDFYHLNLDLALRFPAGWRIENRPDHLLAVAPGGEAMLQVLLQDLNRRVPPREFMTQRLGLRDLRRDRALKVAGAEGYTAVTDLRTPLGYGPTRVSVLYHRDRALILVGATTGEQALAQHDAAFLAAARSYHVLTEEERALARAQRIHLIRADADTRYAALAADSPIPHHPAAQLRLLNGDYPDQEPAAGERIKIVR